MSKINYEDARGMHIIDLQKEVHKVAVEHGWWPTQLSLPISDNTGNGIVVSPDEIQLAMEKLCLIHSEISEAVQELRKKGLRNVYYSVHEKPVGVGIELADAIIRILDFAEAFGLDLSHALEVKLKYNETRPFRHGGRLA